MNDQSQIHGTDKFSLLFELVIFITWTVEKLIIMGYIFSRTKGMNQHLVYKMVTGWMLYDWYLLYIPSMACNLV